MEAIKPMQDFFKKIASDPRISFSHIALFSAIYYLWTCQNRSDPIPIKRLLLMQVAKISSSATYHKTIKALHEYGYIDYRPSFKREKSSEVSIIFQPD